MRNPEARESAPHVLESPLPLTDADITSVPADRRSYLHRAVGSGPFVTGSASTDSDGSDAAPADSDGGDAIPADSDGSDSDSDGTDPSGYR